MERTHPEMEKQSSTDWNHRLDELHDFIFRRTIAAGTGSGIDL